MTLPFDKKVAVGTMGMLASDQSEEQWLDLSVRCCEAQWVLIALIWQGYV
jgi:hypothetical protein